MLRALAILLLPLPVWAQDPQEPPRAFYAPAFESQTRAPRLPSTRLRVEAFATGLVHPWGIASLPDEGFLVTERPGRMRRVAPDGTLGDAIEGLPAVDARGHGGLLDVAVSPGFATDRLVFWTYAKPMAGGLTATAAARGVLSEDGTRMTKVAEVFVQEPPAEAPMNYGSRLAFDDQGHLFVTVGEHLEHPTRALAQDPWATWGKVLRLNPDGTAPQDNPFAQGGGSPLVWTFGHRNPQGLAFDGNGRLWSAEHGPAGGDELNLLTPGSNYGWPEVSYGIHYNGRPVGRGQPRAEDFVEPVYYWDPAIAPGAIHFYEGGLFADWQGDLLLGSLNPRRLVRLRLEEGRVVGEEHMLIGIGRLRDIEELPDGSLLLLIGLPDGTVFRVTPG